MSDLPRALTYDAGSLHFAWLITSRQIEVYQLTDDGKPERRLGVLTTTDEDDHVVEFEQSAFEAHCNWFMEMMSTAEIRVEPE